jgi:serine/threonine protein kinase
MIDVSPHPSLDQLTAFDRGLLGDDEWEVVERHVAGCDDCGRKLDGLLGDVLATMVRAFSGPGAGEKKAELEIPPELVGHPRYRVLRPLGAGGMGIVFQAIHRLMDRVVALKAVHRALLDRPGAVERFRQEIRAAAQLSHPNIVTAYDADQAGDLHFLVMEYVEGTTLDRLTAREGPPEPVRACDWVRQAALGLQHACEQGMVHRDIKPGNLLLTPDGRIKILDFGLARFVSEGAAPHPPPQPLGTELEKSGDRPSGEVLGTPDYVAPEQARDPRSADTRADIYSLGCTLYHLLTGRPPFAGGTDLHKLIAHQERMPVPLAEIRPGLPRELTAVLERMLAKDPAQRYQTPAEVARDLVSVAGLPPSLGGQPSATSGQPVQEAESRWQKANARLWRLPRLFAGLTVLLAAAGVLGIVLRPPAANQSPTSQGEEAAMRADPRAADTDLLSARELALRKKKERDRAVTWVRDHNPWGPGHAIVAETAARIDAEFENQEGFLLDLGSHLVRSGKATLLACRAGELAVFELTAAQAAAVPLPPSMLGFHSIRCRSDQWRRRPAFTLSHLVINGADALDVSREITGSVAYRRHGPIPQGLCLRLIYFPGEIRRSSFDHLAGQQVTADGSLSFSFGSVGFSNPQHAGPLVVFLELCSESKSMDAPDLVIESNTLTALIFVRADKKGEH